MGFRREFLAVGAVARIIGCSVWTARRLTSAGLFPGAFRPGPTGQWRIPKEDVEAWVNANKPVRRKPATKDV